MTKLIIPAVALVLLASPALAMSEGIAEVDTNGDGMLSMEELLAVNPETSAEDFAAMDINGDGALDADEVEAATEAGLMPPRTDG